jgi:hypothetical protein
MKTLNGEESLLMWGASVCCNPQEPPVNLRTTGTLAQQYVLSVLCVKSVSVVSPVLLSL